MLTTPDAVSTTDENGYIPNLNQVNMTYILLLLILWWEGTIPWLIICGALAQLMTILKYEKINTETNKFKQINLKICYAWLMSYT